LFYSIFRIELFEYGEDQKETGEYDYGNKISIIIFMGYLIQLAMWISMDFRRKIFIFLIFTIYLLTRVITFENYINFQDKEIINSICIMFFGFCYLFYLSEQEWKKKIIDYMNKIKE